MEVGQQFQVKWLKWEIEKKTSNLLSFPSSSSSSFQQFHLTPHMVAPRQSRQHKKEDLIWHICYMM